MPTDTGAELEELLTRGDLTPVGRISGSSNGALLCLVGDPADELLVIHKPEATERRLWDYPDGTLVERERAAWLVSEAGGFGVVPPTVLRDGPLGPGSVQQWVGPTTGEEDPLVDVVAPHEVPDGWHVVLEGETPLGEAVVVAHCAEPALRTVAVLDAALNNSDRKGSHLMRDGDAVRGCDHGVSLGVEPKLRTVLWGWSGEPIPEADLARLERLAGALEGRLRDELGALLTEDEVDALGRRVAALLRRREHPRPRGGWPAIPWPAL
ncbi:SCO1664 family protein [Phycicoccus avicenniae]|uniref:SCO1664 family protein n=1 Tax=Phycicoccus avicenniae TaxID=2828860 RepID=UPI003D2A3E3B